MSAERIVTDLHPEVEALRAEVRAEIIASGTGDRTQVFVVHDPHRGYVAEAHNRTTRTPGSFMTAGRWATTEEEALRELSAEWARGCE